MNTPNSQLTPQPADEAPAFVLDFDSDEPLPVCPMRKDGMGDGEICEACQ